MSQHFVANIARLSGRNGLIMPLMVEAGGDIHITLEDASGNAVGTVDAVIPVGPSGARFRRLFSVGDAELAFQS